jgi:methylated-DNA-[protein]-cysteine S-methyltransferase
MLDTEPTFYSTFKTLLGEVSVQVNESYEVIGLSLGKHPLLIKRSKVASPRLDPTKTRFVKNQLEAYFNKELKTFTLKLSPVGTLFQIKVWNALKRLTYGKTSTYKSIANEVNSAPRPVGGAIGRNPIAIIIPCHRVIGTSGELTGFAFGQKAKRFLLQLEEIST